VESVTFVDLLQDMAALVVTVLNGTTMAALMTPPAIVRDTNPRISRRRTLTPLATPTPPEIPTPGEVMAAGVRRKPGTPPGAMEEATIHTAAPDKVIMVEEAIVVKARTRNIVAKRIARKKVAVRSTTKENVAVRRITTTMRPLAPRS